MTGVIADTTSDIHQLTIAIRYLDESGNVQERLLRSINVVDKTPEGMAYKILECLELSGVDSSCLRFQTYDSDASMLGVFNGAQAKLS